MHAHILGLEGVFIYSLIFDLKTNSNIKFIRFRGMCHYLRVRETSVLLFVVNLLGEILGCQKMSSSLSH